MVRGLLLLARKLSSPDHIGSESSPKAFDTILAPNLEVSNASLLRLLLSKSCSWVQAFRATWPMVQPESWIRPTTSIHFCRIVVLASPCHYNVGNGEQFWSQSHCIFQRANSLLPLSWSRYQNCFASVSSEPEHLLGIWGKCCNVLHHFKNNWVEKRPTGKTFRHPSPKSTSSCFEVPNTGLLCYANLLDWDLKDL